MRHTDLPVSRHPADWRTLHFSRTCPVRYMPSRSSFSWHKSKTFLPYYALPSESAAYGCLLSALAGHVQQMPEDELPSIPCISFSSPSTVNLMRPSIQLPALPAYSYVLDFSPWASSDSVVLPFCVSTFDTIAPSCIPAISCIVSVFHGSCPPCLRSKYIMQQKQAVILLPFLKFSMLIKEPEVRHPPCDPALRKEAGRLTPRKLASSWRFNRTSGCCCAYSMIFSRRLSFINSFSFLGQRICFCESMTFRFRLIRGNRCSTLQES